jgi:BirA family biotin operon repressor/biotin-[acetyl-CoA-carboxylase] ligase
MVVIGIGLNIQLTEAQKNEIDQATTSLIEMKSGQRPDRSLIVAALLSCVVDFCRTFASHGLSQFVPMFNESHALHGHNVVILEGERRRSGWVRGLAPDGGLIISGPGEADEIVYVGEVSLRAV